jgi:hypothetical protein
MINNNNNNKKKKKKKNNNNHNHTFILQTVANKCDTQGCHSSEGQNYSLLGCEAMQFHRWVPMFGSTIHSFIHSFIMHSVNPYKVKQPIGYRVCHNANVI